MNASPTAARKLKKCDKPPVTYDVRDTRKPVAAEVVADALAGAKVALEPLARERLWYEPPASFAQMRRFFSCLPDEDRRRVLVHLLADEGGRIQYERSF